MLAVRLKNICKTFGKTAACRGIDLSVSKGRIHALIGENGAGKSTLMKILYGLIRPDAGEIIINGQSVKMKNSQTAISHGLGMVHQHLKLIPRLSVLENIILGQEPKAWGCLKLEDARREINPIIEKLGFNLELDRLVKDLSLGKQQQLEIVKALYRKVQILILDEPTAVLGPAEIEELFQLLRKLRQQGRTIIFISHKLEEVMSLADTITVMRGGRHIRTLKAQNTDTRQLARLMLGREIILPENKRQSRKGKPVLEMKNISSAQRPGRAAINNLSLNLHSGEIVGLAGVAGNGQSELVELLTGLRKSSSGQIFLNNSEVTNFNACQLRQAGVAHIPEDRLRRGLIADFSVQENMLLGQQYNKNRQRWGCWRMNTLKNRNQELLKQYNVQPPEIDLPIRGFSGGNQQKIVLAREITQEYSLMIACQPTRGLDLAASAFVYRTLLREKAAGKAILLVSTELEEIMALSDRIGVLSRGQIIALLDPEEITREKLGQLMGGKSET